MDLRRDFAVIIVLIMIIGSFVFGLAFTCGGTQECLDTVGDRPCFEGSVEYDYDDGECECDSRYGEIEWDLGKGCE